MYVELGKGAYLASAGTDGVGTRGLFLRKNKSVATTSVLGEAINDAGAVHRLQSEDIFLAVPDLSVLLLLQEQLVHVGLLLKGWTRPNTATSEL